MNNNNPNAADAPVPPAGTEQAADQAAKQQPAEPGVLDSVSSVVDIGDMVVSVFDIFG
jgi:hypothetical protein